MLISNVINVIERQTSYNVVCLFVLRLKRMHSLCVLVSFGYWGFGCEFGCPYRIQFKYLCLNMYVYLYLRSFLDISISCIMYLTFHYSV